MKLLNVKWNQESGKLEVNDKFNMINVKGIGTCLEVRPDGFLAIEKDAFEKKDDGFIVNVECVKVEEDDINEIKYLKKAENDSDDVLFVLDLKGYPKSVIKATSKGKMQESEHTFRKWGVKPVYNLNDAPTIFKIDANESLDFEGVGEDNIIFTISNEGKQLKID